MCMVSATRWRKWWGRLGVNLVFNALNKLSRLCKMVNQGASKSAWCKARHTDKYRACDSDIVYRIPLSCGVSYAGQSGRSINIHLMEHVISIDAGYGSKLATHVSECECIPHFRWRKILEKILTTHARGIQGLHCAWESLSLRRYIITGVGGGRNWLSGSMMVTVQGDEFMVSLFLLFDSSCIYCDQAVSPSVSRSCVRVFSSVSCRPGRCSNPSDLQKGIENTGRHS